MQNNVIKHELQNSIIKHEQMAPSHQQASSLCDCRLPACLRSQMFIECVVADGNDESDGLATARDCRGAHLLILAVFSLPK
jgi:hypothetical protein